MGHAEAPRCILGLPSQRSPSAPWQVEAVSDSDTESRSQREFHSIGVQVEEDKRYHMAGLRPAALAALRHWVPWGFLSSAHHCYPIASFPSPLWLKSQTSAPSLPRHLDLAFPLSSLLPYSCSVLGLLCLAHPLASNPRQVQLNLWAFLHLTMTYWLGWECQVCHGLREGSSGIVPVQPGARSSPSSVQCW